MTIIVQHTKTGLYYKEPGVWTRDVSEAVDFGSSKRAIKFIKAHDLRDVQVLVAFIDSSFVDTVALQIPPMQAFKSAA